MTAQVKCSSRIISNYSYILARSNDHPSPPRRRGKQTLIAPRGHVAYTCGRVIGDDISVTHRFR